jgi:hypothetical protein
MLGRFSISVFVAVNMGLSGRDKLCTATNIGIEKRHYSDSWNVTKRDQYH